MRDQASLTSRNLRGRVETSTASYARAQIQAVSLALRTSRTCLQLPRQRKPSQVHSRPPVVIPRTVTQEPAIGWKRPARICEDQER
jgi:hypothetical protein